MPLANYANNDTRSQTETFVCSDGLISKKLSNEKSNEKPNLYRPKITPGNKLRYSTSAMKSSEKTNSGNINSKQS